jgi:hypothetical protein
MRPTPKLLLEGCPDVLSPLMAARRGPSASRIRAAPRRRRPPWARLFRPEAPGAAPQNAQASRRRPDAVRCKARNSHFGSNRMALRHHEYARLHDAVLTSTGENSMANEPATRECKTAAIRDLRSLELDELDAVSGGFLPACTVEKPPSYPGSDGIRAFVDGFYRTCGCPDPR